MSASKAQVEDTSPVRCDGCTMAASPEHLRSRIARLEWASRYRPIHIATLILAPGPAPAIEDFFYAPDAPPREARFRALYEDLLSGCGVEGAGEEKPRALAEFQRGGFFLAHAVECPAAEEGSAEFDDLLAHLTPTVVRRVRTSYLPKSLLVLSPRLAGVARALGEAGIEAEMLPRGGDPVPIPEADDADGRKRFREKLKTLLTARA